MEKVTLNPLFEAKTSRYPQGIRSGAGDANYLEPLLDCIIIELNKLMRTYQAFEEEK